MDCIQILKNLNIFLTTFFTGLLALFGFFQWQTINKQNKQNLFKMRMEHYIKFNSLTLDMSIIIRDDGNIDIDTLLNKLKLHLYQIEKITPESKYLFDDEIYSLETFIIEDTRRILERLKKDFKNTMKEKTDSKLLKEAHDNIKIKIEKFLKV